MDKELKMLRNNRWDKAFSESAARADENPQDVVNRKATIVIEVRGDENSFGLLLLQPS